MLVISYIGRVGPNDLVQGERDLRELLASLPPGFGVLADLSLMESMDPDCLPILGRIMDLCQQRGVGKIVRVIPDPEKDIGFNIMTIFHYPGHPQIITCSSLIEAGQHLSV